MTDPDIIDYYKFCLKEVKKSVERQGGHHWSRIRGSEMYERLSLKYDNLDEVMHKAEAKLGWYDYTLVAMTETVDHFCQQAIYIHHRDTPPYTHAQYLAAVEAKCRTFERGRTEEFLYEKGGNSTFRALVKERYDRAAAKKLEEPLVDRSHANTPCTPTAYPEAVVH